MYSFDVSMVLLYVYYYSLRQLLVRDVPFIITFRLQYSIRKRMAPYPLHFVCFIFCFIFIFVFICFLILFLFFVFVFVFVYFVFLSSNVFLLLTYVCCACRTQY